MGERTNCLEQKGKHDFQKEGRLVNFLASLPDTIPLGAVETSTNLSCFDPGGNGARALLRGAVSCLHIVTTPVVNAEAPADTEQTCWTV